MLIVPLYVLPCRCLEAARVMQGRMAAESGVDDTVDHLHRTIYGALLAGRSFKWMRQTSETNTDTTATETTAETSTTTEEEGFSELGEEETSAGVSERGGGHVVHPRV